MKKQDIIKAVAGAGFDRRDVKKILDAFVGVVEEQLMNEGTASLLELGKLSVSHRKAYTGSNPSTGAAIEIKARNTVVYRPSKSVKASVNEIG